MKKQINKYLTSLFLAFITIGAMAQGVQKISINSSVKDADGNPIFMATIRGDEGASVAYSDENGNFTIQVPESDVLRVEADGFEPILVQTSEVLSAEQVSLEKKPFHLKDADKVQVPFGKMKKRQIVGAVNSLNAPSILEVDNNQDILNAIRGRVPGMFGNRNMRGLGSALIVIDGIPRSADDIQSSLNMVDDLNMQEIQSITVLKDASARILYGAQADQGVILINTKRGTPYKRQFSVTAEAGMNDPISYPKYLNAGDYMTLYNEALVNDGLSPIYSDSVISATRSGIDPVKYPDEDYFNDTYLKDVSNFFKVITEASGGNDKAQYYANLGWTRNGDLYALGSGKQAYEDRFNFRGNVDYQLNDWLKASLDAVGIFGINKQPNGDPNDNWNGDFWQFASEELPNAYPVLIPASQVSDSSILGSAKFVDGNYILGGTNQFRNNIYGNLSLAGYRTVQQRIGQVNTGLDFDLNSWTEGLSAKAFFSFDMLSEYTLRQDNQYAVYARNYVPSMTGEIDSLVVTKYGNDEKRNDQSINETYFQRRLGFYGTLDYHRIFNNKHEITATGVGYLDQVNLLNEIFSYKNQHFGLRANYMYANKYIAEFNGAYVGSGRLEEGNNYAFSPSIGGAWVLSEEGFLNSSNTINYLKLKASYGSMKTDRGISDYYLYQTSFQQNNWFNYNQSSGNRNRVRTYQSIASAGLGFVARNELNAGLEALFFNNKLWLEFNYFNSTSEGNVVQRGNTYPSFFGGVLPYENYESYQDSGIDLGLNWSNRSGDLEYIVGVNFTYVTPKAIQVEEPQFPDAYRLREGKSTDSMFGYVAEGLFRDSADITSHALQTFGEVRPGDIKYKDLNNDGFIDEADQEQIGTSRSRMQYDVNLTIKWKGFSLFALGTGQSGSNMYLNNPYYWVYGNTAKYSEVVTGRWTPTNASSATYPRLTTGDGSNNFRNSTYWIVDNNWFTIHTAQLSYNIPSKSEAIKGMKVYLRGSNLATFSKVKDERELNIGIAPQMRSFAIGLVASF